MKTCPVCGGEVIGHPNKVYCSKKCKRRQGYLRHRDTILADSRYRFESDKQGWIKGVGDYKRKTCKRYRVYHNQIDCPKCGRRGQLKSNVEVNIHTENRLEYFYVTHIRSVREGRRVRKLYLGNCYLGSRLKMAEEYGLTI